MTVTAPVELNDGDSGLDSISPRTREARKFVAYIVVNHAFAQY